MATTTNPAVDKAVGLGCTALVAVVIAIALVGSCFGQKTVTVPPFSALTSASPTALPTSTTLIEGNRPPDFAGEMGRIHVVADYVYAATTRTNYDALIRAFVVKDEVGVANMLLQRRAVLVENGTDVLVLERHFGFMEVRVLGGKHFGIAVWIQSELVDRI